jgi:hypothetical protein
MIAKLIPAVTVLVALVAGTSWSAKAPSAHDCCFDGSACCYAGSPCCADDCCDAGAACCDPPSACCATTKALAKAADCCSGGECCDPPQDCCLAPANASK